MSTMIERVARALMEAREGCRVTDWREAEWNPAVAQALSEARAAIAAMREPTKEMVEAGDDTAGTMAITHDYSALGTWEDMIDTALQEKTEGE